MALPVTFTLTSTATQTAAPFAFGHVFAEGDVPAGSYINSDLTDWQARPTTYWPDGSVRHAIIAGRVSCTANVPKAIVITASGTDRSGTALTETDLTSALPATTLACGAETITLGTLVGTAALHRTVCTGPIMSNWLYRKQLTGSDHLVAWFDVRLYLGGAVEIFPWIENGYLLVASPTNDVRTYTLTIGGVEKFSQSLDIKHHTRIPLMTGATHSHWTTDPQITPKHDTAYIMAAKMTLNYGYAPSETVLSNTGEYATTYIPNWLGTTKAAMASTGYGNHIGVLPNWAAGYLASSGDYRAYAATIVNGMAAGSWPVHYRDNDPAKNPNEPLRFTDYPNISQGWGGTPAVPNGTGGVNQVDGINAAPDRAHQPSLAFLPWLLTGRWFFLDEHLFWLTWSYLQSNYVTREGAKALYFDDQVRSRGWVLRTHAQALAILPADHPCFASVKASWEYNTIAYKARYVDGTRDSGTWQNNIGWMGAYSSNPGGATAYFYTVSSGYWWDANWQQAMIALAFATAWDFKLSQSTASADAHLAVRNFSYSSQIGLAGDGSAGTYSYRRFATFQTPIGSPDTAHPPATWLADWGAVYSVQEAYGLDNPNRSTGVVAYDPLPSGTAVYYGNEPVSSDKWAWHSAVAFGRAVLAYAAEHGVTGAVAAYARITGASNYSTEYFSTYSGWAVEPRVENEVVVTGSVGNAVAAAATASITSTTAAVSSTYSIESGMTMYCGRFAPTSSISAFVGNGVASGSSASISTGDVTVFATVGNAVASGRTFSDGALPAWVPTEGTFANISLNTLNDVRPTGWPTSGDVAGPFANFSGGVRAEDFSSLGAYVVHASGHLTPATTPQWAGVWCFDLDTRQWVGRNVPGAPLPAGTGALPDETYEFNQYAESTNSATLGHTSVPHTYDGLVYRRASQGGGASGDLIRVCFGGVTNVVHKFDLSSPTSPATRIIDSIGGTSYPQTARDDGRNGFWYLAGNGNGPLKFVSFTDWSITTHSVSFNEYGDYTLIYVPAPNECLVSIGRNGSGGPNMAVYVSPFASGVPQPFVKVLTLTSSDERPLDTRAGGVWSTLLNCIVSYGATGSYKVHKFTPPAGSLTDPWTLSFETLTGVGGATPGRSASSDGGAFGRFIEFPAARCFIWCDSVTGPVQAWRLTGM